MDPPGLVGDGHPKGLYLGGNPYNGYIKTCYWVDDPPTTGKQWEFHPTFPPLLLERSENTRLAPVGVETLGA